MSRVVTEKVQQRQVEEMVTESQNAEVALQPLFLAAAAVECH